MTTGPLSVRPMNDEMEGVVALAVGITRLSRSSS